MGKLPSFAPFGSLMLYLSSDGYFLEFTMIGGGITHLQYIDDTLVMVERLELDTINLKFLLTYFKSMSGLMNNSTKSEAVILGYSWKEQHSIANILKFVFNIPHH